MTIGERIKFVRTHTGLTQQKFADILELKRNTVGGYEIGTVVPSERTIKDICKAFNVNLAWLSDGTGEPFIEVERDDQIMDFLNGLLTSDSSFKKRLVSVLAQLDEDEWVLLEKMANKLLREEKNADQ